ncbi:MAG: VCBS repeat-containing protein [Rhodobacteraceae bacterium]|nr:VCBS repeat-containing protein [Paracoccaceae bacterium]
MSIGRPLVFCAALALAGPATAEQAAHCWYPFDGKIGCENASPLTASGILKQGIHANLVTPVQRYGHNILGDTPEWGALRFVVQGSAEHGPYHWAKLRLPKSRIFEDVTPRLVDFTGDGQPEILVVETDLNKGARLAVYHADQAGNEITLLAATPYIGTPYRWLAPIGVADFNGDGMMDVAYVDRPHLAQTLRVWTLHGDKLVEIAKLGSVTNHRIGDNSISSGVRDCGAGPEMLMHDPSWKNLLAVRFAGGHLEKRKIGRYKSARSLKRALDCKAP